MRRTSPIGGKHTIRYIAVNRRMRPISRAFHIAMFHRVDVHVIHMRLEIAIIANRMLPKSLLPNVVFTAIIFGDVHPNAQQMFSEARFDE